MSMRKYVYFNGINLYNEIQFEVPGISSDGS